ncbi:MAG: phosphoribosylglycinamide formyltransferase [Burkholderiaceae bacterium]
MMSQSRRARLVVLISGRGSNLQAIVRACVGNRLAADVVAVVSNRPGAAGLAWATRHGIEAVSIDHRTYRSRVEFDGDLAEAIAARAPDWIVLAGFMRVLGPEFIDRFAGRLVNIHPSLLPLYPGLGTHERAIADGVLVHGATVHLVTNELDHGPIVAQAVVAVRPDDDAARLAARVLALEHRLYVLALRWLVGGRAVVREGRVVIEAGGGATARLLIDAALRDGTDVADEVDAVGEADITTAALADKPRSA